MLDMHMIGEALCRVQTDIAAPDSLINNKLNVLNQNEALSCFVRSVFPPTAPSLGKPRETEGVKRALTDEEREYIARAYKYVASLLEKPVFDMEYIAEINNICRWGAARSDMTSSSETEYYKIAKENFREMNANRDSFCTYKIGPTWRWFKANRDRSPYELAAGLFARMVVEPQMFWMRNEETGSVMAAYIFARAGIKPFYLDIDTAPEFFYLSDKIRLCSKFGPVRWMQSHYYTGRFAKFLQKNFKAVNAQHNGETI